MASKTTLLDEKPLVPWLRQQKPWVTIVLILVNTAVFAVMYTSLGLQSLWQPTIAQLVEWGADWAPLTLNGQEWRLLSSDFEHIGIIHVMMNMYVLWLLGKICERLFGSGRYLFIYILSGIGAGLFSTLSSLLIMPLVSAGSSGSICGIIGAYFGFVLAHKKDFEPETYKAMVKNFARYGFAIIAYGFLVHADHAAHVGGFVVGWLTGAVLVPKVEPSPSSQRRELCGIAAICVCLCALTVFEMSGVCDRNGLLKKYMDIMRLSKKNMEVGRLIKQRKYEQGAQLASQIVKEDPTDAIAYSGLAACQSGLNDNYSAYESATTALKLTPNAPHVLWIHALTAYNLGDYDVSLKDCAQIPANNKYHGIVVASVAAHVHALRGDVDQALKDLSASSESTETEKSLIYAQAGKFKEAEALASQAVAKDPQDKQAISVETMVKWHAGQFKDFMKLQLDSSKEPIGIYNAYRAFAYFIAAKHIGDANPDLLIDRYRDDIKQNSWTKKISDYLSGRITAKQLIDAAQHRDQKTEAYGYAGLNEAASKHPEIARPYLQWVVGHGIQTFNEFWMARDELARLPNRAAH